MPTATTTETAAAPRREPDAAPPRAARTLAAVLAALGLLGASLPPLVPSGPLRVGCWVAVTVACLAMLAASRLRGVPRTAYLAAGGVVLALCVSARRYR